MESNSLAADPSKLSYFSLPGEIRNKIMNYVLVPGDIHPYKSALTASTSSSDSMTNVESHPGIQLIATCKQAYEEGHKLFYSSNTFHLPPTMTFEWVDKLQAKHKAMVKRISITIGLDELTPEMLNKIESSMPADVDQKNGFHWAPAVADTLFDEWISKFKCMGAWESLKEVELRSFGLTRVHRFHGHVFSMEFPLSCYGGYWYKVLCRERDCVVGNIFTKTEHVGWERTKEWLYSRKPNEMAEGFSMGPESWRDITPDEEEEDSVFDEIIWN